MRLQMILMIIFALCFFASCAQSDDANQPSGQEPVADGDIDTQEIDEESEEQDAETQNADGFFFQPKEAGDIALMHGERALFSLKSQDAFSLKTFTETVETQYGQYKFTRENEAEQRPEAISCDEAGIVCRLQFAAGEGRMTLEAVNDDTARIHFEPPSEAQADALSFALLCDEQSSFYGFGEQYNKLDQRGEAFRLMVSEQGIGRNDTTGALWMLKGNKHTTYFPMPYFIDPKKGYGLLIESDYRGYADLCASDETAARFEVVDSSGFSALIFAGEPEIVLQSLGEQIGRPTKPPAWAFEPWICTQGGREAVLEQVALLEEAAIPFRTVWVQDWTGKRRNLDGGFGVQYRWEHDEAHYPDLAGMIAALHEKGIKVLGYVNPFVQTELENHFPEMDERGLLIKEKESGESYLFQSPAGSASHPDFTNPEAGGYVQDALAKAVRDLGLDGWMADFAEYQPLDAALFDGSDSRAYHNRFPVEWARQSLEVMKRERPDGDFVWFSRSGWTGVQETAMIHWVGDQEADWSETDGLPTVVPAMLNLGLSGQPYVTHDIAGFSGGPSTKELYFRWTELAAFTPFMRTHDGNNRSENWRWDKDEETKAHFKRFALVHQALAEDFIALADEAKETGLPILRPLWLVFPEEEAAYDISDQFMIGKSLLVAPVVTEGAESKQVYLPSGEWYNVWTGEALTGGGFVEVTAPLGSPPVFSFGTDRADLRQVR